MAIDWTYGYTARWRVDRISAETWEPCGTLDGIDEITVERDATDDVPLLESASAKSASPALDGFESGWHRITMECTQGTAAEAVAIATLWLDAGSGSYDKGYREDSIQGRSVLWQASDAAIGDGAYAPKGVDGAAWCAGALSRAIDAPVKAVGGFELADNVVFDLDASVLQAVWDVLRTAGWCLQIDGRGEVSVIALPASPALVLDRNGARIMQPKTGYGEDGASYTREYQPNVHPLDIVRGALPERGLDGLYRITTQKLTCGRGVKVEETAEVV